jgi:hypothetical protein
MVRYLRAQVTTLADQPIENFFSDNVKFAALNASS